MNEIVQVVGCASAVVLGVAMLCTALGSVLVRDNADAGVKVSRG